MLTRFLTPVRRIHQIEITSRCNLSCVYCVHGAGTMKRLVKDMDLRTYEQALGWVRRFCDEGSQGELNLAGIGESTLHPEFPAMLLAARAALGPNRAIILATNGVAMSERIVNLIAPAKPRVYVSLHRPEKAARAVALLQEAGILAATSCDAALNPNDWAGQVEWVKPTYKFRCHWLGDGNGFVASTGAILACCLDASGITRGGSVAEEPGSVSTGPSYLCRKCYHLIDRPGFDQSLAGD